MCIGFPSDHKAETKISVSTASQPSLFEGCLLQRSLTQEGSSVSTLGQPRNPELSEQQRGHLRTGVVLHKLTLPGKMNTECDNLGMGDILCSNALQGGVSTGDATQECESHGSRKDSFLTFVGILPVMKQ